MENRHAVCIMAHKNAEQLNVLLHLLDHPQIDIYSNRPFLRHAL